MDERKYLAKAKEADAIANATESPDNRRHWEGIAQEYRRLATSIALERGLGAASEILNAPEQEIGDIAERITRASTKRG